jgi:hypothetical protein
MSLPRATVHRLRPRGRRQAELLQGALDLGGWSEATRVELNQRLTIRSPEPELWRFAMIAARQDVMSDFLRAIGSGPRSYATLATWYALAPFVRRDTGEVVCTQRTLAKTASIAVGDVSRALARLVEIGALEREDGGKYRVNPSLMWKGELANRENAEKATARATRAKPRIVEPA